MTAVVRQAELPPGLLPMDWLGRTAVAIAASEAPERDFGKRAAELAAIGYERLGAEEIERRAVTARGLNLSVVDVRDVRHLADAWQRIWDLWGSPKRMQAAYDAAYSLADSRKSTIR